MELYGGAFVPIRIVSWAIANLTKNKERDFFMNPKFTNVFESFGLSICGNYGYGVIQGYETNVALRMLDNVAPVLIHISCYTSIDQKRAIEQVFKNAKIKSFRIFPSNYGVAIGLNDITVNKLLKRVPDILNLVFQTLKAQGALDARYCPICGKEMKPETTQKVAFDGFIFHFDKECISSINQTIESENKNFEQAPNNYFKGFLGALAGGFIGAVVSMILYMVGFVSAFSAFVAIWLGVFFYKRFKGKPNKMMIVIVSLTTLVCMAGSVFGIYLSVATAAAREANLGIGAFEAFSLIMQDAEISASFFKDLAMTLFFSLVGIGYEIFALAKSIKRQKAIQ